MVSKKRVKKMKKKVKELKSGDIFLDSFGLKIKVLESIPLKWNEVPRTSPRHKIVFLTENNNTMYMNFRSNREVEVVL